MEKIKNAVSNYFEGMDDAVVTTRREVCMQVLVGLLAGIILGILIAPPRKVKMGCGNGNNNIGKCENKGCDCGCDCGCDAEQDKENEED